MRWLGVLHPLHIMMHVATSLCKLHHVTPLLKSLPWLKVPQHIHFKIAYLSNNALQTSQPSYICQLLTVRPTGSTRSSLFFYLGLQSRPHLSLGCSRSPERTPNRLPSVCSSQLLRLHFHLLYSTHD